MTTILLILFFACFLIFIYLKPEKPTQNTDNKHSTQIKKLWTIAQSSMQEKKPARAEKALLAILKFDEKNAAAYNRLGILYAKSQKWEESIECFEIAQSIDNNPSSLHNMGLIYLEIAAYEKAVIAFTQALKLEGGIPSRHLALAKAEEKLGHFKIAIEHLESAFELDRNISTLRQILAIHEILNDTEMIDATNQRIEKELTLKTLAQTKAPLHKKQPASRSVLHKKTNTAAFNPHPNSQPLSPTSSDNRLNRTLSANSRLKTHRPLRRRRLQ